MESSLRENLLDIYKNFFDQSTFSDIRQLEIEMGYSWVSVIPYMKLAFHPYAHTQHSIVHGEEHASEWRQLDR